MSEPSADDRAREALTEQFNRKEPTESKIEYSEQEWIDTFERPWIIPDKRYLTTSTQVVGSGGHAYCRRCPVERKHGKLAAYRLHVAYEADVMKVAKNGLIHVTCHNCEFDMYIPRSPKTRGHQLDGVYDEAIKLDPIKMQDMINRATAQQSRMDQTRREIELRYGEAMRRIAQAGMDPSHERELIDRLQEQIRRNAEMASMPVKIAALDKWPPA